MFNLWNNTFLFCFVLYINVYSDKAVEDFLESFSMNAESEYLNVTYLYIVFYKKNVPVGRGKGEP